MSLTKKQRIAIANNSPLGLGQFYWPKRTNNADDFYYRAHRTNKRVNKALRRLHDPHDKIKIVVISQPPRTGKSLLASKFHPSWYVGKYPHRNVLVTGYSSDLCEEFGSFARGLITEVGGEAFGVSVNQNTRAKGNWKIADHRGGMRSVSIMGQITGFGYNHVTVDDPYANYEDAHSPKIRNKVWREIGATVDTRMEEPSTQSIVACLAGDSRVLMSDGTAKLIRDVTAGDMVMSMLCNGLAEVRVTDQRLSGVKKTYRVKTKQHELRATDNHPFLTVQYKPNKWGQSKTSEFEWKSPSELKAGDIVVKPRQFGRGSEETVQGNPMAIEFLWLLGFMFGDGWVTKYGKKGKVRKDFTQKKATRFITCFAAGIDDELNARVKNLIEEIFDCRFKFKAKAGYYRCDMSYVGKELYRLGLTGRAKTKRIPKWVYGCTAEQKRAFIKGFCEADGFQRKKGIESFSVKLCQRDLLEDLRWLSLSSGIQASKCYFAQRWVQPPNSPQPIFAESWMARFMFLDKPKHKPKFTYFPFDETLELAVIESVEEFEKEEVYDLQVDGPANFVAEGFVVHNTRWHPDDASGRYKAMAEAGDDTILVIDMPATAPHDMFDEDDKLFAKEGELLYPWQWSQEKLDTWKRKHGAYMYSALFDCAPTTPDGTFWEESLFLDCWFNEWPETRYMIHTIDPAAGAEVTKGCDSAIIASATSYGAEYFVDADLAPSGPVETVRRWEEMVDRLDEAGARFPDALGIEHNATQVQSLLDKVLAVKRRRGVADPRWNDITICEIPLKRDMGDELGPTRDKDVKIQTLDPYFRDKQYKFKASSPGSAVLVQQCKFYGIGNQLVDGLDALEMNAEMYSQVYEGALEVLTSHRGQVTKSVARKIS